MQPRSAWPSSSAYIFAPQINDDVYDGMFRAYPPAQPAHPESVVLAIDELTPTNRS